jgi:serine/threonine protein kinase
VLGTLLGNYRVVEQLSEGGMGVVYIGHHETLGRRVVVKVLQRELCNDADMVQRFFNEARAATAIRSPGIVQVFDFGHTPDQRAYFVMELLEGESLSARLKRQRCDAVACCRLGRQVANVLHAAHAAGIVHRDLKPPNLFLVPDPEVAGGERVKVLDFGIAKLAGEARTAGIHTGTGLVMGTPFYMSPEQCRSAAVADARSDIYSLGCILFEIACGRPPFVFAGVGDIVAAHLHEAPPYPQNLAPDIPAGLSALIARMLAKHPDSRPQTMAAVGQALDDILRELEAAPAARPSSRRAPTADPTAGARAATPPAPAAPPALGTTDSSLATTIDRWPLGGDRNHRRLIYVLGAIVVVGAGAAIAFVVAGDGPPPPERKVTYASIVAESHAAAAAAPAAIADSSAPVDAPGESARPAPATAAGADSLAAACRQLQLERKWTELARCADRMKPVDPKLSASFATRAVEETRSAPHVAAVGAALDAGDLKRAWAEFAQIWPDAADAAGLKRRYFAEEAKQIDALATLLEAAADASCQGYQQQLARHRASDSPRVVQEAARRAPCTVARPSCDADGLVARGSQQFSAGQYAQSLATYEAAYACRPASVLLQKQLVVACNLHDLAKARALWRRLSPAFRGPALPVCVRAAISEAALSAP